MQSPDKSAGRVADAQRGNWVDQYFPNWLKPYGRLARWDRPTPLLLLFWPCAFGLALATVAFPERGYDLIAFLLFLFGAAVMRGAGCTLNDIVDADIDMKVARTRSRPIPSGQVSKREAALFLGIQLLVGFVVLVQFNWTTMLLGVSSLVLVAIYPFMKRVTWWPQLFLGLAFNWGALLGWSSQTGSLALPPLLLYAGAILWTIGYDTIYAMQDTEDDALIGVKSTARLFGRRGRLMVALFYAATLALWVWAGLSAGAGTVFLVLMLVPAGLFAWQVRTLDPHDATNAMVRFRANHWVGVALTVALLADWVA
ncbi:MAG: 4-hydroxybenzoate octaprenyltransferase [Devosia sp.]